MGLISIDDYVGSEIGNAVLSGLDMYGVVNKLNMCGYHLEIEGVQRATPKGMIDDTPSKHKVIITRNKFIRALSKREYANFLADTVTYNNVVDTVRSSNIAFKNTDTFKVSDGTSRDASNSYIWYKHEIVANMDKPVTEMNEHYIQRMFKTIADYIIQTFESME